MEGIKERINEVLEYTTSKLNTKFDSANEVMNLRNSLIVIEMMLKSIIKN